MQNFHLVIVVIFFKADSNEGVDMVFGYSNDPLSWSLISYKIYGLVKFSLIFLALCNAYNSLKYSPIAENTQRLEIIIQGHHYHVY